MEALRTAAVGACTIAALVLTLSSASAASAIRRNALINLVSFLVGGGVAALLLRRRRMEPSAPRREMASFRAELVPITYPRPICQRCGYKIRVNREGDTCWLVATESRFSHLHKECADRSGNPLP